MDHLPTAESLTEARKLIDTWGNRFSPDDAIAPELVAICIANLSRRRPDGWTERDLLVETTLPLFRFDPQLLHGSALTGSDFGFGASRSRIENIRAIAQYLILNRPSAR